MSMLRILLFLGLVLHKLIWEHMKGSSRPPDKRSSSTEKPFIRLVKSVKILALIVLVLQTLFLNLFPISRQPRQLRIVGVSLYVLGLTTAVMGRVHLGNNWANIEDRRVLPNQALVTTGIYRFVRHPIYVGDSLLLIGLQLALNSWLFLGGIAAALLALRQATAEEKLLAQTLLDYDAYRQRTKSFIPLVA